MESGTSGSPLRSIRVLSLLVCLAVSFGAGSSSGQESGDRDETVTAPPPTLAGVPYRATFKGIKDDDLEDLVKKSSRLIALSDKPPSSLARLKVRVDDDITRLTKVLRSEGYYDSKITPTIDDEASPVRVSIAVATGPAYILRRFDIDYGRAAGADWPTDASALGLKIDQRARAADILRAEGLVLRRLAEIGHPFAEKRDRRAVVDHDARTMTVTVSVDPGSAARLGRASIDDLPTVDISYLRRFVGWRPGERYDQRKVDAFATRLRGTGLFDSVLVEPAETLAADGTLAVNARLKERKARSIGAGLSYSTSEGVEAEVFWEHRNLFGRQETLRLTATAGEIRQSTEADIRIPHHRRLDQDLVANTTVLRQSTDAFREISATQTAGVERRLNENWTVAGGGLLELSKIVENEAATQETEERFFLVGLPLWARRDDTDNPLDPTRGSRLHVSGTPFYSPLTGQGVFLRSEAAAKKYQSIYDNGRVVAAGRVRLGMIAGEQTDAVPSNKRFFAGGGGSIRGFGFQEVGPLDAESEPIGGRSVFEIGAEIRWRVTDTIGIVPFVEAGNVYDSVLPDFSRTLRVGAGLGFRYFSPIGPLRLDFALPLNAPAGVSDGLQFYVSVGQAF